VDRRNAFSADLPAAELLDFQNAWLGAARSRLLRRAGIARRRRVLEVGCGFGQATGELARRAAGIVVGVDRRRDALTASPENFGRGCRVSADARRLPFSTAAFDLVFCQFALMWLDAVVAVGEIYRVLQPGGVLLALEPDYEAMIEHPPEIGSRDLWLAALRRAGAATELGRRLPGICAAAGFSVRTDLLERVETPDPKRFDFLEELPLDDDQRKRLAEIRRADAHLTATERVAHLPVFLVTAEKPAA
jgi:SAM-dependent methyltransferase